MKHRIGQGDRVGRGNRITRSLTAMPFSVPLSRSTTASEPGPTRMFKKSMLSYCSQTMVFEAMVGEANSCRRTSP